LDGDPSPECQSARLAGLTAVKPNGQLPEKGQVFEPFTWAKCRFFHLKRQFPCFRGSKTCPGAFRDDWPIPRKGRPLDSTIGLHHFLPAAGHVLAKILFYTGFTKREGGSPKTRKNDIFRRFQGGPLCHGICHAGAKPTFERR